MGHQAVPLLLPLSTPLWESVQLQLDWRSARIVGKLTLELYLVACGDPVERIRPLRDGVWGKDSLVVLMNENTCHVSIRAATVSSLG